MGRACIVLAILIVANPIASASDGAGKLPLWVDLDAGCDGAARRDVDDCLALLHLIDVAPDRLAGISTTFGNAPIGTVDSVTAELVATRPVSTSHLRVWSGAAASGDCDTSAARALRNRLRESALELVALGPLTNVACVLRSDPSLASGIVRIVAVMGARPGHVFHPAEDRRRHALLGHGPVFSDFNFVQDRNAARSIVEHGIPLVLVPYEAGRLREIGAEELAAIRATSESGALVAGRARPWLEFWRTKAGREGFFPFDLVAAALVTGSDRFDCGKEEIEVTRDHAISMLGGPVRLLLLGASRPGARHEATVCTPVGGRRRIRVERLFRRPELDGAHA
jgi:inosine-uridine nucleoside N-ribohydrolase